jgi:ssDNA-binding Zn-finger/Zn-ribbon topoisomerase 1
MIKRNVKKQPKVIKNLTGGDCPICGHPLVYRINRTTKKKFISCSNYFNGCNYKPQKSIVNHIFESLSKDWEPNISSNAVGFLECIPGDVLGAKGSGDEIKYMLGAAYFLDHLGHSYNNANGIRLDKTEVRYNNKKYVGIGFFELTSYWGGGTIEPSAMAFVPQLVFADKLHHDFGVFFSSVRYPTPADWKFELVVEVDSYYKHRIFPGFDKNRDMKVNYQVIRLDPNIEGCGPKDWFSKVMRHWANKFDI